MRSDKNNARTHAAAFTLVELLVVVAIMGVMMSIAIPSFKKLFRKDPLALGAQQLLDDLEWARIHAMSRGADVSIVFFPLWSQVGGTASQAGYFQSPGVANALLGGQCASYVIFAEGSAGEQPGQPVIEQTFLTKWRRLPQGVVIPANAFNTPAIFPPACDAKLPRLANDDSPPAGFGLLTLPAIRFHAKGDLSPQLIGSPVLSLEHYGTNLVYAFVGPAGPYLLTNVLVSPAVANPRRAQIEISALTGRSKIIFIQP